MEVHLALQRLFNEEMRYRTSALGVTEHLLASMPAASADWSSWPRTSIWRLKTLLSGYLLSSQGDRMSMAHSVEGRFPFLDRHVVELAHSLPDSFKLRALDEKHILKRVATGLVPEAIIDRPKQPYRAPDAAAFVGAGAPDWPGDLLAERAVVEAGVFDSVAVSRLWSRCMASARGQAFGNADNMALVGVLSTGLLYEHLMKGQPSRSLPRLLGTVIDLVTGPDSSAVPVELLAASQRTEDGSNA